MGENIENRDIEEILSERSILIEALTSLCQLKDYKDTKGKDKFYEKMKDRTWKRAFDVLDEIGIDLG